MIRQRTIERPAVIEGIGLQTGTKTKLNIKSAPANSGINFIRVDLPNKPLVNIQSLSLKDSSAKGHRTTLGCGPVQIHTSEHFLAAVSGLRINNIIVEINGVELPGLDGSAKGFVDVLERSGIVEQDALVEALKVEQPVWCADKNKFLAAFPYNGLHISYFLSYPVSSIGDQFLSLDISEETFKNEIAPARTFCMKKEVLLLRAMGFGKGANYNNTLIMGKTGPVNNVLRFPDEHVRHKILDLIGDLCLVGMPLNAHVIAVKSGHGLNMELVKKLKEGQGSGGKGQV